MQPLRIHCRELKLWAERPEAESLGVFRERERLADCGQRLNLEALPERLAESLGLPAITRTRFTTVGVQGAKVWPGREPQPREKEGPR